MNRFMILTGTLVGFLAVVSPMEAQTVNRIELDNGITVLTKPLNTNNIVSVVVALKMGSLYESDEKAGLSELMQNTILKGTSSRSSEQIALELESMGTKISASSNREYGTISMQSTKESLYKSLDILYDVLLNATFPDDEVALQKRLQEREILVQHDQPIYRAIELMVEAHYGSHPFHKPRLGYPETIRELTRDETVELYHQIYVPNNMVISIVGNFDESGLLAHIDASLGNIPQRSDPIPISGNMPVKNDNVEKIETRESAASWFALGWSSPSIDDDGYYAMEVLDSITGGSMNSRLFVAIREKRGLAYQVSSFVNARKESGVYVAYIGTKPESYDEARTVLIDEVRKMGIDRVTDEELENAKSYLRGMNIMSMESNGGQASRYAHHEIIGVGYDFGDRYDNKISNVKAEDVLQIGKKYLLGSYALGGVLAR